MSEERRTIARETQARHRRELFVDEYLRTGIPAVAAARAGYASPAGLMDQPDVQEMLRSRLPHRNREEQLRVYGQLVGHAGWVREQMESAAIRAADEADPKIAAQLRAEVRDWARILHDWSRTIATASGLMVTTRVKIDASERTTINHVTQRVKIVGRAPSPGTGESADASGNRLGLGDDAAGTA